jgi:hypothetical protein
MVHLVEDLPETVRMAEAVPPVEEERADEPPDKPLGQRRQQGRQVKEGVAAEDFDPNPVGREGDRELTGVDQQGPGIPTPGVRQLAPREEALQNEERDR